MYRVSYRVGPRADLDFVTKTKIPFCCELSPGHSSRCLAAKLTELYRLLDCGFFWVSLSVEEVNFTDVSVDHIAFFRVYLTEK
jgi:hypothetical protein